MSDENANNSVPTSTQVQQIFDEYVLRDDDCRTRNPLEPKKVVENASSSPSISKLSVGGSTDISTKLLTNEVPCLNENICHQISREQSSNTGENLSIGEVRNECAQDCNGDLIGGCELIEEWHLPFIGAEVVCVPDSMSGELERTENNGECDLTANIESQVTQTTFDAPNFLNEQDNSSKEALLPMISYTTKSISELTSKKATEEEIQIQHSNNQNQSYSHRCSYEEMVHVDTDVDEEELDSQANFEADSSFESKTNNGSTNLDAINSLRKSLVRLTQWALTLQEVYEERETIGLLHPEGFNCNCKRALNINESLSELESEFLHAIEHIDHSQLKNDDTKTAPTSLQQLKKKQSEVQNILRTHVSIQVSRPPGKETRSKAAYVVGEVINHKAFVHDAINSVKNLVNDLLNTDSCEVCLQKQTFYTNIDNKQDLNKNTENIKDIADMTIKIPESKSDFTRGSDTLHNISKNKRKRKQIFFKLQQEDNNTHQNEHSENKTDESQHSNDRSSLSSCDSDLHLNSNVCLPESPTHPSASKRAKTLKASKSQLDLSFSSPPRPRRPLMLASDAKRKNKSEKPIIRSSKLNLNSTSNSVLKPIYLRPIYIPPDEPNVMRQFLECKKKLQRVDGLHDWVLWKETLKESIEILNHKSRYDKISSLNKLKPRL